MANKDYERMVELGKWLERYLDPSVESRKIKQLFQKGAALIGISESYIFNPGLISVFDALIFDKEINIFDHIETILNSEEKQAELIEPIKNFPGGDRSDFQGLFLETIKNLLASRKEILFLLTELQKEQGPWKKVFAKLNESEPYSKYLKNLNWSYSSLREEFDVVDGEYQKVKVCDAGDFARHFPIVERNHDIISANIFFNFLLLGGQDYFLFCEYCGKFTSIQRKGRKKYCSDICRVSHRNAELAKR